MLIEPEQIAKLPEYREESVVKSEDITAVLNHCFRNVISTEEYFFHQSQKRKKGLFTTISYFVVPTRFLSCLVENGAELSFEEDCSLKIRYGKNKKKTSSHHLYGVFKGKFYGEEEVLGLAIGNGREPHFESPPDISDPNDLNEMRKIFEEIGERVPIKDINHWKKIVRSNND